MHPSIQHLLGTNQVSHTVLGAGYILMSNRFSAVMELTYVCVYKQGNDQINKYT